MNHHDDEFEFDLWARLADHDPRAFEAARARVLQSLIESAPDAARRRLEGLQWRVDRIRETADNPMAACLRISGMMWDAVLREDGLVDRIEQLTGERPVRPETGQSATVVALVPPADTT